MSEREGLEAVARECCKTDDGICCEFDLNGNGTRDCARCTAILAALRRAAPPADRVRNLRREAIDDYTAQWNREEYRRGLKEAAKMLEETAWRIPALTPEQASVAGDYLAEAIRARAAPPADGVPIKRDSHIGRMLDAEYRRGLEEAAIVISEVRGSGSTVDECMRVIRARAAESGKEGK